MYFEQHRWQNLLNFLCFPVRVPVFYTIFIAWHKRRSEISNGDQKAIKLRQPPCVTYGQMKTIKKRFCWHRSQEVQTSQLFTFGKALDEDFSRSSAVFSSKLDRVSSKVITRTMQANQEFCLRKADPARLLQTSYILEEKCARNPPSNLSAKERSAIY